MYLRTLCLQHSKTCLFGSNPNETVCRRVVFCETDSGKLLISLQAPHLESLEDMGERVICGITCSFWQNQQGVSQEPLVQAAKTN